MFRQVQFVTPTACCLLALFLIPFLAACTTKVFTPDDALGEWEKEGPSLPPINLLLSRDGARLLARLRLSGIELNGVAKLEDNRLLLDFPTRGPMAGEFTSITSLNLRLGNPGEQFVLTKKR